MQNDFKLTKIYIRCQITFLNHHVKIDAQVFAAQKIEKKNKYERVKETDTEK